jgi:hypothetical protein
MSVTLVDTVRAQFRSERMKTSRLSRTTAPLLLVLTAVLLAAVPLGAAPVPKERLVDKDVLYVPTKVGAKRVYNRGDEEQTDVVTAVEHKPKEKVWVVTIGELDKDGKVFKEEKWEVSNQGLVLVHRETDLRTFLKLPHRAGEMWAFSPSLKNIECVALEKQRVEVPAGEFEAVGVEIQLQGGRVLKTWWFAPGVGLVRIGNENSTYVLKSFTPGKD